MLIYNIIQIFYKQKGKYLGILNTDIKGLFVLDTITNSIIN